MEGYKFSTLILLIGLIFYSCGTTTKETATKDPLFYSIGVSGIEIKGRIENLKQVQDYFYDNTHITIINPDQKFSQLSLSADGNIIIDDRELPQTKISIKLTHLNDGKYILLVQPLKANRPIPLFDLNTKEQVRIRISKEAPSVTIVDLGNVNIGSPK